MRQSFLRTCSGALQGVALGRSASSSSSSVFARRTVKGFPMRIRPAVGDQGKKDMEGTQDNSVEKDSDWILVQDKLNRLSPRILKDAHQVMGRDKWAGEGVVQKAYDDPCVSHVACMRLMCSSEDVADDLLHVFSALVPGSDASPAGRSARIGDTVLAVEQPDGWVMAARNMMKREDFARVSAVEWAGCGDSVEGELVARGIKVEKRDKGLVLDDMVHGGMMDRVKLASAASVVVFPPSFSVDVGKVGAEGKVVVEGSKGSEDVLIKEMVMTAAWDEHAKVESLLDRLAGCKARKGLGLWTLPSGLTIRLVPSDFTGIKAIVLKVASIEAAKQALETKGFKCQGFPKYVVVGCAGLDLRLTDTMELDPYFNEIRFEVLEENHMKRGRNRSVSCVGAITYGAAQNASRMVRGKY